MLALGRQISMLQPETALPDPNVPNRRRHRP
jgi:hypothetical protein